MHKLDEIILSITDKVLYSPLYGGTEYPNYLLDGNTLYLPVKNKTYKEVAENLHEALTGEKVNLFDLHNKVRKEYYDKITGHPLYESSRDTRSWDQII